MSYSLDENYVDQGGCTWSSINSWFFIGILGGCGCGTSEEISAKAVELLKYFGSDYDTREPFWGKGESYEILAHWIDSKELIDHGYTIASSFLNEKGKEILAVIKEAEERQAKWEIY